MITPAQFERVARDRLRAGPGGILRLRDGRAAAIRPALPADGAAVQRFVRELSPLARRRRFLGAVAELAPDQLDRLTRVRDPRDLALVALSANAGMPRIVAMAQYASDDPPAAECAVVVADAWQRQGLGERLLEMLLARAAEMGLRAMSGFVLGDNWPMLALTAKLGFDSVESDDRHLVRVARPLPQPRCGAAFVERLRRLIARFGGRRALRAA